MDLNIQERKLQLIQIIAQIDNEQLISSIEAHIQNDQFHSIIKPMKKKLTIEDMIKEQNYSPINREQFYDKVSKLNIEEPLHELLAMLTK